MSEKSDQIKLMQKEKDDFIYIVAHDLNAPIRHIKSFLEILLKDFDGQLSEEQQEYKDIILNAAEDAQDKIAGLLELSRFTASQESEYLDIAALILAVIEAFDAQITFENKLPSKPNLQGDTQIFRRALSYIIENALTHNQGHDALRVHIDLEADEAGHLKLIIEDNGCGVPEKSLDKLTRPFFALENGRRGLGLAFAEKAVTAHNGRLRFYINGNGGLTAEILFLG